MKKLWGAIGTSLWWPLWPVWVVYFRISGKRSRVLVLCEGEVLLIQDWLGNKEFGLPGGGAHRHENLAASAVRELYEETGIKTAESSLTQLGSRINTRYNLRYFAEYFVLRLHDKPQLSLRWPEIFFGEWFTIEKAVNMKLNDDARYALKRYQPPEQASLL